MLLWPASALLRRGKPHSLECENQGRFPFADCGEREVEISRKTRSGNSNIASRDEAMRGDWGHHPRSGGHPWLPYRPASSRVV